MPYRPSGSVGVSDDSRQATHCWNDDAAPAWGPGDAAAGEAGAVAAGVTAGVTGVREWPSGTFTSSPTVMRLGLAICGLAASTRDSEMPAPAAMPLRVSPARTVWVLASAGPAARPASTAPAPTVEIIRIRTFIKLLVRIDHRSALTYAVTLSDANRTRKSANWAYSPPSGAATQPGNHAR